MRHSHTERNSEWSVPLAILAAGAFIAVGAYFGIRSAMQPVLVRTGPERLLPVSPSDHIRGNIGAKAIVVEYSDTECPFCKKFHLTLKQLVSSPDNQNGVAWVYRHYPITSIHSKARKEAWATECAAKLGGEEAFWAYTDRIFELTPSNDGLPAEDLDKTASDLGLDLGKFDACMASGETDSKVQTDFNSGTAAGVRATPTSFIVTRDGNYPINGAISLDELRQKIEAALQR